MRLAVMAMAMAALSGCAAGAAKPPLAGTSWQLVELRSSDDAIGIVRVPNLSRYTLAVDAEGNAAFRLDRALDGDTLRLELFADSGWRRAP